MTLADSPAWRSQLEREYQPTGRRLQDAYGRAAKRLAPLIAALIAALQDRYEVEGEVTLTDLRGLEEYRQFMAVLETEMDDFARVARSETDALAEQAILTGGQAAQAATLAEAGAAAPIAQQAWSKPSPETLALLLAVMDGDAYRNKWAGFGEDAAAQLIDVLRAGVERRPTPAQIEQLINSWLAVPYAWAESTSRTAVIWVSRLAMHAAFAYNTILVEGWIWESMLTPTTCISCWNMHGTFHTNAEVLRDHHLGLCRPRPKIIGIDPHTTNGRAEFEALSESEQRAIMGPGLFKAWSAGQATWNDMTTAYSDQLYRVMLRPPTLKSLGIKS